MVPNSPSHGIRNPKKQAPNINPLKAAEVTVTTLLN
jgi:hypothetical protein